MARRNRPDFNDGFDIGLEASKPVVGCFGGAFAGFLGCLIQIMILLLILGGLVWLVGVVFGWES
ncbi:MAG: hypothetical protein OXC83_11575 [Chloroflexi bacterium]|nr:hypothetical protein [Chloroflexota bacterium]